MGAALNLREALAVAARSHPDPTIRYGLTATQRRLYDFIAAEIASGRPAPSYDQMCRSLGTRSKSSVFQIVAGLVERGAIVQLPKRRRSIALAGTPEATSLHVDRIREERDRLDAARATLAAGVPVDLHDDLFAYCQRRGQAPSEVIADAIREHMRRNP